MGWIYVQRVSAVGRSSGNINDGTHIESWYVLCPMICTWADMIVAPLGTPFLSNILRRLGGGRVSDTSCPLHPVVILKVLCHRELLLLEGIALQGLGNWQAIAEHVGTRTKEEVQQHYKSVYVDSPNWPLPVRFFLYVIRSLPHITTHSEWTATLTSIPPSSKNANDEEYRP